MVEFSSSKSESMSSISRRSLTQEYCPNSDAARLIFSSSVWNRLAQVAHLLLLLGVLLNPDPPCCDGVDPVLVFLSNRIICKRTDTNCSLHPGVFQDIESIGKQKLYHIYRIEQG
jgi:hypothetical protein